MKKVGVLTIIFLIILFKSFAQENRWSLSIQYTPIINNIHTKQVINTSYFDILEEYVDSEKAFTYGYDFGINIGYKIDRFEILSGIKYVRQENKEILRSYPNYYKVNLSVNYFAIPIIIKYNILREKTKLYTLLGVDYRHVLSYNFYDYNEQNENPRKHHFYMRFGLGSSINIINNFNLLIEPSLSFSINNYFFNHPNYGIKYYPYSIGLKTGIAWSF